MDFSFEEIRALIELDQNISMQKQQAQKIVAEKWGEINKSFNDLQTPKNDLSKILNASRVNEVRIAQLMMH